MSRKYDAVVTDGIVRIAIRGAFTGAQGADAVALAVRKAGEVGASLVLFDIRGLDHPAYHASVITRADNASKSGISAFKVAILGDPESELLAFIENVATNRGLRARCFTDEAAALRWLKASR
ncbi:MAG TPA: hypothetical protein VH301_11600 [Usitatibacter sp.]|jgi:hypothetical protein|nr:hypothetical protein [Usitatibacter sp.]